MDYDQIYSIAVKEICKTFTNVKGIYVFGSFASGTQTDDSDLDIAILLDKPADSLKIWETAENIASKIQRNVDLIDLLSASTVFQFQIITTAKRIDTIDFNTCDFFEDLTYAKYIRLNESRQEILNEIKKRGKIY